MQLEGFLSLRLSCPPRRDFSKNSIRLVKRCNKPDQKGEQGTKEDLRFLVTCPSN